MSDLAKTNHFDPLTEGEREELHPAKETTHDMYTPDTSADPEGSERRVSNEQQDRMMYANWLLKDYEVSSKNYYGKLWPDGKAHLVPKESFIEAVLDCHNEGMAPEFIQGMHNQSLNDDAAQEAYKLMSDCYGRMIELGRPHTYNIIVGIGSGATNQLAERAYRRYLNDQALDGLAAEDSPNQDWIVNRGAALMQASIDASVWVRLHEEACDQADWRPPEYAEWAMRSAITKKLVKLADNNDKKYRNEDINILDAAKAKEALKLVC